jgi:hypothetical protein
MNLWDLFGSLFAELQTVSYLLVNGFPLEEPSDLIILGLVGTGLLGMSYQKWLSRKMAGASSAGHQAGTNEAVKAMVEAMKPSESGSGLNLFWIIVVIVVIIGGLGYLLQGAF